MIGTITVNPSIDQLILVRGLVKDDANRAVSVLHYPGGKGINVSKVVRELGGGTHAFALLGGRPGELLAELLRGLDVPLTAIAVKGHTRINTIVTDLKDGTQTRISAPGPVISRSEMDEFERKVLSWRPRPFIWALGGSLSEKMTPAAYCRLVRAVQKKGTPCVLDTDGEALRRGIEARPFLIKPNEYEVTRLIGRSISALEDYLGVAKGLVKKGIKIVVVSLGARGALFVSEREAFHVSVPQVAVRSKVGAGDSLIGGFVLALSRRKGLEEAARIGMAASVSAVMRESPRLCLRRDLPGILPKLRVRALW
ncbi:MAG: 1-phosphofructokinase family hexose kinase [Candidatus Omnitrophica bacterium]|nr:1-phosphofructokinase family hexose kinase [Candidatus Omnitrophota bacterium]